MGRDAWHSDCFCEGGAPRARGVPQIRMSSSSEQPQRSDAGPFASALYRSYHVPRGACDEMLDAPGAARAHWRRLVETLDTLGPKAVAQTQRQLDAMVRENGVTYNVYGDPRGQDRPWSLDLLPVILSAAEWSIIESGMTQRIRLLNEIAADVYGPQRLLRDRVLRPEILFANPLYLRACRGIAPGKFGHVPRYAADLVRAEDGRWRVSGDRTQAASGSEYALENRTVLSQVFPGLIAEGHVRRLTEYYSYFREMLLAMAPRGRDLATLALWTPGPLNEVYFEHVFLAKYFGLSLVEGDDLTVRDNRVYLKTIEGLEPVDVIVRRVDDEFCDPLELLRESRLGVAGLLHASRFGHVAMCNALGAAVVESPAFAAMLPRLCRHFLGEDLQLEPAPIWWGGDPEQRAYVDDRFDELHIAPAFQPRSGQGVIPGALAMGERNEWYARWHARPHEFVATDPVRPSTVPVMNGGTLEPRSLALRTFAVGGGRSAHVRVMPGGLARFGDGGTATSITMQRGGGSKDVWVLAEGPGEHRATLSIETKPRAICRSPGNLPSRLAENLLWLGRYCERAEHGVRFMRHVAGRSLDEADAALTGDLRALMAAVPYLFSASMQEAIDAPQGDASLRVQDAVVASIFDGQRAESVVGAVQAVRRMAWTVRERFSDDDWRIVNGLTHEFIAYEQQAPGMGTTMYALNQLVRGFAAFAGLAHENMTREPGQVFLQIGRRLERTVQTVDLVGGVLGVPDTQVGLMRSLLAICDSPMTYRARYGGAVYPAAVIDLLVCDETNPRSVAFQVQSLATLLGQLPGASGPGLLRDEQRAVEKLRTAVRVADPYALGHTDAGGGRPQLTALLAELNENVRALVDHLGRRYFIHTASARQLEVSETDPA